MIILTSNINITQKTHHPSVFRRSMSMTKGSFSSSLVPYSEGIQDLRQYPSEGVS